MQIDKRMNLVVPVYADDETTIKAQVHSTPLSAEMVERHFMLIGQTFNTVFKQGLGETAGPRFAMMLLRRIATNLDEWEVDDPDRKGMKKPGPAQDLVNEMRRLTNVAIVQNGRWSAVPLDVAVQMGVLTAEERSEVENVIVFFIAVSAVLRGTDRRTMLTSASALWGARITSLDCTAFTASLTTSTATDSSGEKSPADAKPAAGSANAIVDGKPSSVPS